MGVLPDVPALDRVLDYLLPEAMAPEVEIGTIVRIPLGPRRVRGWVVALEREPPEGVALKAIAKVTGRGPAAELFELADWAAWRWAGRRFTFLRAASPERAVRRLPSAPRRAGAQPGAASSDEPRAGVAAAQLAAAAFDATSDAGHGAPPVRVLRWPPAIDPLPLALAATRLGQALVLAPAEGDAVRLGDRLRDAGVWVAPHGPAGWAAAAAGATVVGSRAAAWAPAPNLAAVLVLDEHDARYQDERAPTWHARDVVVERARRGDVPIVLASPAPTLEALAIPGVAVLAGPRSMERAGWPALVVVDRRRDDPRSGLYSPALVDVIRHATSVVVVLNRTGRARLLACSRCGELVRCERCGGALSQTSAGSLACRTCEGDRPAVCAACGATRLAVLRPGVSRVREELEALSGRPFLEVTAATAPALGEDQLDERAGRCWVGTVAVLHRVRSAEVVAFLDIDQELLAPRYRAGEQTLALLAQAARVVGGRASGGRAPGRLLAQTRLAQHEVLQAVVHADPGRWSSTEALRRDELQLPPVTREAFLSGVGAAEFAAALRADPRVTIRSAGGTFLVRAASGADLAAALATVPRPTGRLRVEVDPLGI